MGPPHRLGNVETKVCKEGYYKNVRGGPLVISQERPEGLLSQRGGGTPIQWFEQVGTFHHKLLK